MKIAYCIHSLCNPGGTERVLSEKASYLCDVLGYDVTIITAAQKGQDRYFPLSPNVKTIDIGVNFYSQFRLPRYLKRLEAVLKEIKPDICVSLTNYEIYGLSELDDGSIKMAEYHFSHDRWFLEKGRHSIKAKCRTAHTEKSVSSLSKFVVLTKEDKSVWDKIIPGVEQIYNPSPYEIERAPLQNKELISIGRLTKQKNFSFLIDSWASVAEKHPDWVLRIYGNGELKTDLTKQIESLRLEKNVILEEKTKDIKQRMLESSGMVMSSLYEGFPMVLVEAQSLGLPLISTDCQCGPSEIIENGRNGFLVPMDDPSILANRICQIIEDEALRKEMGRQSSLMAQNFDKKQIMAQWDELFKRLIEERDKTAPRPQQNKLSNHLRFLFARMQIQLEGDVLNPLWWPRERRRQKSWDSIGRIVTDYMSKYHLQAADRVCDTLVERNDSKEKIWTIWLQGEKNAPALVKSCLESIRKNSGRELVVLDDKTVLDHIELPKKIVENYRKGKIRPCHFSDICRVQLLYQHGGYWMDATCFMFAPIPEFIKKEDFFVYMYGQKVSGNYCFIQNCFIRARKGSPLLAMWRAVILDYWDSQDKRLDYFMHQVSFKALVQNNSKAKELFEKMPQIDQYPTHKIWYELSNEPYDSALLEKLASEGYFYQKTTYRGSENYISGSWKEYLLGKTIADVSKNLVSL